MRMIADFFCLLLLGSFLLLLAPTWVYIAIIVLNTPLKTMLTLPGEIQKNDAERVRTDERVQTNTHVQTNKNNNRVYFPLYGGI